MLLAFNECGRGLVAVSAAALTVCALGAAFPSAAASNSRPPAQTTIKTYACPADDAECADRGARRKYKRVSMAKFRQILKTAKPMGRSSGKPVQTRLGEFALYDEYDPRRTMSKQGVHCVDGSSYPCWCEGAAVCRNFRAACRESNGALSCGDGKKRGRPTRCSCHK